MSPTRRANLDGLRRGVGQIPAQQPQAATAPPPIPATRTKPVRVTLNFPPELFRDLDRWTREAADAIGAPRVGVQDAVRAMVRVITSGEARDAEGRILTELRQK